LIVHLIQISDNMVYGVHIYIISAPCIWSRKQAKELES